MRRNRNVSRKEASKNLLSNFLYIRNKTAAVREEMLLWEESIHNWNRKTEEQGKENEWMSIHRGLHPRYNIIMFIRVFCWLIKVDVINCCLIHNTNAVLRCDANISNDITTDEYNRRFFLTRLLSDRLNSRFVRD